MRSRFSARFPRATTPSGLTPVAALIVEPYRTQVWVAGFLGLRASEIMPLRWSDFDFTEGALLVQRSMVHGRVADVKTEYSRERAPLDPAWSGFSVSINGGVTAHPTAGFSEPGYGPALPPGRHPATSHPPGGPHGRSGGRDRLAHVSAQLPIPGWTTRGLRSRSRRS